MILRIILLVFLVWIGATLYRKLKQIQQKTGNPNASEQMLQCNYCQTHIPASQAIVAGDKVYCCPEHQQSDAG